MSIQKLIIESENPSVFRNEFTIPVWVLLYNIDSINDDYLSQEKIPEEFKPLFDSLVNQIYFEHDNETGYVQIDHNTDTITFIDKDSKNVMEYSDPVKSIENVIKENVSIKINELIEYMIFKNKEFFKPIEKIIVRNYDNGQEYIYVLD